MDVPARRAPCVLGARHAAVSKGVSARCSTKDSRKGSLPDPRNAAQRGSAKSAPHEACDHAARLIPAVAAPKAPGHHSTPLCNCRDELPNFAREIAGEANAEAGDWWKRAQEGEHRTPAGRHAGTASRCTQRPPSEPWSRNWPEPPQRECRPRGRGGWKLGITSHCTQSS